MRRQIESDKDLLDSEIEQLAKALVRRDRIAYPSIGGHDERLVAAHGRAIAAREWELARITHILAVIEAHLLQRGGSIERVNIDADVEAKPANFRNFLNRLFVACLVPAAVRLSSAIVERRIAKFHRRMPVRYRPPDWTCLARLIQKPPNGAGRIETSFDDLAYEGFDRAALIFVEALQNFVLETDRR